MERLLDLFFSIFAGWTEGQVVGLFIGAIFMLMCVCNRVAVSRAKRASKKATADLAELRKQVLVVAGNSVPGREIKSVIGHVTGTAESASREEEAEASEKRAMLALMTAALERGANAVVDVRLTSSTFEEQGSQWQVSKPTYTGTAVVI